ncbi:beta-L-arabinofuranosidase domain-containing protein [Aquisphaera insulae]|uniref:beta-L-arabinofuranosidase domain-containing protein n=1 Tax=Aquisphaera insulae TaxID=2712864 RepID=UPI0013EA7C56|nr:beta-L-arabinofuranosidase domain-containing protein [Aquisphaera insulae]
MNRTIAPLSLTVILAIASQGASAQPSGAANPSRPAGIPAIAFHPLPLGSVKPAGWLREQLRIQAAGLGGHLDEFWLDIKDSAWIGGKSEGWERVPYWLDGLVPLAYLLDDAALQAKAKRFIDYILDHQHPDGWLGPIGDTAGHQPYDAWPLFPLLKALAQYQEATGDPRVIPAMLKCARRIEKAMDDRPLYSWARMRVADFAVPMLWLALKSREAWPMDVARKAYAQSHDWKAQFDDFKFTGRTRDKFDLDTHGVNTGMALKYAGIRYLLTGAEADRDAIFPMLEKLDRYHGQATGIFTCDEHLAGRNPSQGTELCTVVEAMYSLELLAAVVGDARLGDRLEKLAFNALPATFKKDMTAHQYDQQANQVLCVKEGDHLYVNNGPDSNLYGLEPNFGCCTANFHQGWPKFASSLWMRSADGGLAAVAYAPCVVEAKVKGKPVRLEVRTDYPFRDLVEIVATASEPVDVPLRLRIPAWANGARVAVGDATSTVASGTFHELTLAVAKEAKVTLRLPAEPRLYHGFNDSVAVERGPLVFALPVRGEWKKVKDNPQFADWEVRPASPWNYALEIDRVHPEKSIAFEDRPVQASPFATEAPALIARVKGRRLPGWVIERGAAAAPPSSPARSDAAEEELSLVPYGCTDLRVTEFPTLDGSGR